VDGLSRRKQSKGLVEAMRRRGEGLDEEVEREEGRNSIGRKRRWMMMWMREESQRRRNTLEK